MTGSCGVERSSVFLSHDLAGFDPSDFLPMLTYHAVSQRWRFYKLDPREYIGMAVSASLLDQFHFCGSTSSSLVVGPEKIWDNEQWTLKISPCEKEKRIYLQTTQFLGGIQPFDSRGFYKPLGVTGDGDRSLMNWILHSRDQPV